MVTGKFISLNVRGISNFRKRKMIFTWCRKQKADVIFLRKEWGASLFCSSGANNARGVAILIRNNFDCVVEETVVDTNCRFIILKVILKGEQAVLVNVYGPNRDNKLVDFCHLVLQSLKQNDFDEIENIIMGGDFSCPLNPIFDKRGGNLIPRQSVINTTESLQSELDLHDIWRAKKFHKTKFYLESTGTINYVQTRLLAYFKLFIRQRMEC